MIVITANYSTRTGELCELPSLLRCQTPSYHCETIYVLPAMMLIMLGPIFVFEFCSLIFLFDHGASFIGYLYTIVAVLKLVLQVRRQMTAFPLVTWRGSTANGHLAHFFGTNVSSCNCRCKRSFQKACQLKRSSNTSLSNKQANKVCKLSYHLFYKH